MADYDSGLPIRSEADGTDERVQTKIVDATNPDTQQMEVDTDGNSHVEVHGNRADDAADVVLNLSEEGKPNPRGDYEVDENSEPASVGMVAGARSSNNTRVDQTEHITSIEDSGGTVRAMDMSLHDEDGEAYTANNPLPVAISEFEGDEVCDYQTSASVASDASVNHDYAVTAAKTFIGSRVWVSGSGKLKVEVQLEDGPAAGTYTTKFVGFNSTSNPNVNIPLDKICGKQVATANVRLIITNRDNQPQDLYSTLVGIEK